MILKEIILLALTNLIQKIVFKYVISILSILQIKSLIRNIHKILCKLIIKIKIQQKMSNIIMMNLY